MNHGMGTKVQIDNYLPGYHSMRDLNHDTNDASWPGYFGENNLSNGQHYYGVLPKPIEDAFPGYDRDLVKQTMLRHEAIFKNQVFELHRLYRVQKDLMDEIVRKDQYKPRTPYETSSSSSALPSQIPSEDSQRRFSSNILFANSSFAAAPPVSGSEFNQSSSVGNTIKGKSIRASPILLQNCSSPKHSEASESRPTKVRKMLDLQLPADEYIDTDEVEQYGKAPISDHCEKTNCQDRPRSDSSFRKVSTLADLNEPVQSEEATANHIWDVSGASKLDVSTGIDGWSKDGLWSAKHGNMNGATAGSPYSSSKLNVPDCLSPLKSEVSKGSAMTINCSQPEKMAIHSQASVFEKQCQPPGFIPQNYHVKEDPWTLKRSDSFKGVEKSHPFFSYHNARQVVVSNHPNLPSYVPSSELADLPDHFVSSCKPSGCFSQKSISVHTLPFYNPASLSKSSYSTARSNEYFGSRWNSSGDLSVNGPGFRTDPPMQNGFYKGSPSGYKESFPFPLSKTDFSQCVDGNFSDKVTTGSSNNLLKGTSTFDLNTSGDFNHYTVLPNGLPGSEQLSQPRQSNKIRDTELKREDHLPALPWLRNKAVSSTIGSASARDGSTKAESGIFQGSYEPFNRSEYRHASDCQNSNASTSGNFVHVRADGRFNGGYSSDNCRKILGVPIFQKPPPREEEIQSAKRKPVFDINMPCDPLDHDFGSKSTGESETVVVEKKADSTPRIGMIDLNLCIEDDEVTMRASVLNCNTTTTSSTKRVGKRIIDLEAPVDLEAEDDDYIPGDQELWNTQHQPPAQLVSVGGSQYPEEDKIDRAAAEAIVTISSSCYQQNPAEGTSTPFPMEETPEHPLNWFVDVVFSHSSAVEAQPDSETVWGNNGDEKGCMSVEDDDFETLTLRLTECSEEEYLPKPSAFDIPTVVEIPAPTPILVGRPRRGGARRGRQKRDFQRDILPSISSLSRHEVTEDLQTFGGLMQATGHAWQCGSRRNAARNGSRRGRRRSVVAIAPPVAAPAPATANVALPAAAALTTTTTTVCALAQKHQHVRNGEIHLEDGNLTSWGKTTRRPRRQRCPPPPAVGNPTTAVPLT